MGRWMTRASVCGLALALAATLSTPTVFTGAATTAHGDDGHDDGGIHWSAGHVDWLYSGGVRTGVRGHATMGWDDCWGPTGMRITVRYQRHVGDHWVTTQVRRHRQHYQGQGDWGHDYGMHWAPTFQTRPGDLTHATRMRFIFHWYDGARLHASRRAVRIPD